MYARGRRASSAQVAKPTPRTEQIANLERFISEAQAKLATCSAEVVPSYERKIANFQSLLKVTLEAA